MSLWRGALQWRLSWKLKKNVYVHKTPFFSAEITICASSWSKTKEGKTCKMHKSRRRHVCVLCWAEYLVMGHNFCLLQNSSCRVCFCCNALWWKKISGKASHGSLILSWDNSSKCFWFTMWGKVTFFTQKTCETFYLTKHFAKCD